MRICNYNIEWMNSLFHNRQLELSNAPSSRHDITKKSQLEASAEVLRQVNADVYIILEAPNDYEKNATKRALETFAKHFSLRQNKAITGTPSPTDQEIVCLYDPDVLTVEYQPHKGPKPPKFSHEIAISYPELAGRYHFSKPPLELLLTHKSSKRKFNIIGAHLKTKAPHGAHNDEEVRKISLLNRKKQIAEAIWLRARIKQIRRPLIVCGDFNDGPGYDSFEERLGLSCIDILTDGGLLFDPSIDMGDALSSARFFNRDDLSYKEALIDFAFVNSKMRNFAKHWEIWHPLQNQKIQLEPDLQTALLTASDHFPVSIDIAWP